MNFNLDDPLADLLSDHSLDNDNFFGSSNKKPVKKPAMDDLFGIKEDTALRKPTAAAKSNTYLDSKKPIATSTPRITRQQPSLSNEAEDDDDDLGFDPRKPKLGTKTNLFDDLLGPTLEVKRPATAKAAISRQSTDTTTDTTTQAPARPKTSTGRRNSGNSAVINPDPLGLFVGTTRDHITSGTSTPKTTKKRGTTADWLGLNLEPESNKETAQRPDTPKIVIASKSTAAAPKETVDILKLSSAVDNEVIDNTLETPRHNFASNLETVQHIKTPRTLPGSETTQNMLQINTMNLETQNAFNVLQQQEAHLALATQMKQQERALCEMQRKQESLLQQQEQQFGALLQQQMQRQQQLEEHIKSQQQRINNHIQLMMTQPVAMLSQFEQKLDAETTESTTTIAKTNAETAKPTLLETVQLEADIKRLELEKLRLEELVENLKTNYEKQFEMIENSFRKQLEVLEDHLAAVEKRLKTELEELHIHYAKKLMTLTDDKQQLKTELEANIAALKQDHDDELRKLRKSQENDLEMLKEEHRRMLETIRQSKVLEFAAIQENGSYLETLKAASNNLSHVSGDLQTLRTEMQTKIETINRERESKLDSREKRLEDAERRLQLSETNAEDEKRRLMELVSTLEVQLAMQSKDSAEDNWLLRQKMTTLDAEKAAFEREKTLMREQFARDEKRVEDLKEQQLLQQQRHLLELQDERARLNVERAKIETERRLQPANGDLENQRLEIEAALKVAQDATRQADAERVRFQRQQRELEQQRRELIDKKNTLRAKEEEVEQELHVMRMSERKSLETQKRAHAAEQNFRAKIQYLQQRMGELGEKEAQLSQEQLLLAQERIKVQNLKTRVSTERKCALCKMSAQSAEITQMLQTNAVAPTDATGGVAGTGVEQEEYRTMYDQSNAVERLLDDNVAESYRRMRHTVGNTNDYWTDSVLDDDSKELALHNFDTDFQANNDN